MKTNMSAQVEILEKLVKDLLGLMKTAAKPSVSYDEKNEAFIIDLDAEDETGLLIGKKGETLSSLQTVLGLMFKQITGEWHRVVVDVGDYREKEEDYLTKLALSAAARAKETGESQSLYNLKPWQRRIIHMTLGEDKEIVTESVGEGEERYLIIKSAK